MNNLAFKIYGTKKATPFQSVWKTDNFALGGETANKTASSLPSDWALAPGGTNLLTGGYTHNGSGSSVLLFPISSAAFDNYQIVCTLSAGSTGSVVIGLGNVFSVAISATSTIILNPTAGSGTLTITPVNFVGTVSLSVKASSSAANQIQLPITSIPVGKSIWIDWGDNSYTNANNSNYTANRIHTYTTPGEYVVRILGDNFSFGFGNTNSVNDRLKIKSISSWGKLKLGQSSFNSCSNLTLSGITDVPDLTGVTSFSNTFANCSKITTVGRMNEWNTSSVNNLLGMFSGCLLFNQCIGGWNVSNVTTFEGMFYNCYEFNNGDNSTPLNNWTLNTTSSVSLNYPFINCKKFNRYIGDWNTSKVNIMADMFQGATIFNNGFAPGVGTGNQLNWDTSSCTNISRMFVSAPAFNSNISSFNVSKVTTFFQMFAYCNTFNNGFALGDGVGNKLPWNIGGNVTGTITMGSMFQNAVAFNSNLGTGTTPWNVSKVTTFASMFQGASNFNNGDDTAPINDWNIGGNITGTITMGSMFNTASKFNRNISGWNMTKVTNIGFILHAATIFNQPIGNWERSTPGNVSTMGNVTDMSQSFRDTNFFNQCIGNWNVSKVNSFVATFGTKVFNNGDDSTPMSNWNIGGDASVITINMFAMFIGSQAFNKDISAWNMTKVTATGQMFWNAIGFNQPLSNWERVSSPDTSTLANVTNMNQMFQGATSFNQSIGTWNVSQVTSMQSMLQSAIAFNQPIGTWNVSNVTNMSGMFLNATSFNQPIGAWNVSKVNNMKDMFQNASSFDQPIAGWERVSSPDTSTLVNVNSMQQMFLNASAFNQNIGNWNVSNVYNFSLFMAGKTFNNFSTGNLNAIYNGWIVNGVKPNTSSPLSTNISFGTIKYTSLGTPGKNILLAAPNNWIIQDGGI